MKRKEQRDLLVKSVFAHFFQKDLSLNSIIVNISQSFSKEKVTEIDQKKYFAPLVTQLDHNELSFQAIISKHLKKTWKIERLPLLDIAILEVAIAEINYLPEIPFDVTVNEAVDLTKKYSTEKSPSFVNGILVSINRDLKESNTPS